MDDIGLLQLQGILLDRVTELLIVLETPAIQKNPAEKLESVDGQFDSLMPQTSAAAAAVVAAHSMASTPSTTSLGGAYRMSQSSVATMPTRIAVVAGDATTRHLVTAMLTTETAADVVAFPSIDEAAADPAFVVVLCVGPAIPFEGAPRAAPAHTPPAASYPPTALGRVALRLCTSASLWGLRFLDNRGTCPRHPFSRNPAAPQGRTSFPAAPWPRGTCSSGSCPRTWRS